MKVYLHPSIPLETKFISGEVNEKALVLEGLLSVLSSNKEANTLLILDDDFRPGYLILHDKTELRTTKQLYSKISSDMEIRIIPISHGG
jgi:hypothetical protein